jgi:large subunit ribosomal protein L31e
MSSKTKKPSGKPQRSAIADVVAREYTIHMHKRVRLHHKSDRQIQ